ncbi:MAG: APC family permease [Gemmatimonadales bacterium]|nr:APC family permease [Gemmatimonadales bacterium]
MPEAPRPALARAIGRWTLTAIVINSVIGSGVFGLPGTLTGLVGAASPLAVLAAGAGILLVVLCFAEVASRFDETGGPYRYAREAFGPASGFLVGWLQVVMWHLSAAAVINVFASYSAGALPALGTPAGRAALMAAAMVAVAAVNVLGVRQASWTVTALTLAKVLPLVATIALGIWRLDPGVRAAQAATTPDWTQALLLLAFAYAGFEGAVVNAAETRDPTRDTAFALLAGMLGIGAIYALMQVVVVGVLPDARQSTAAVADTLRVLAGEPGALLAAVAVAFSALGWLLGFGLSVPRIVFAMAERGELPAPLGVVHPRLRTPHVAVLLTCTSALGLGLLGSFGQMATFAAIAALGIYTATCAAMLRLRATAEPAPFRAPGGAATGVGAILFCGWLLTTLELAQAWLLPVVLLSGWGLWALRARR